MKRVLARFKNWGKGGERKPSDAPRSFRLTRRTDVPQLPKIMTVRQLLKETWQLVATNRKLCFGIAAIYVVAYRFLAEGVGRINLADVQQALQDSSNHVSQFTGLTALTAAAFTSSSSTSDAQGKLYASLLTVIFILCMVWAVRQLLAGHRVKIRDALYNGPTSLIPFTTVLLLLFVQAIPMAFGIFLYGSARASGIAATGVENFVLFMVAALASILSSYWLSSTIIALVASTLPGMYPLAALRGAKELVIYRRWQIFLRILMFVLLVGVVWIVTVVLVVSNKITIGLSSFVVDMLRGVTLLFGTVYLYKLYRSLVDEEEEFE